MNRDPRAREGDGVVRGLPLLRYWRAARGMSQLQLSSHAGVSARHISFIESGRAKPSRWILEVLADALALPPRDRGELMAQAGLAPDASLMSSARVAGEAGPALEAVSEVIEQLAPYPAMVIDRRAHILRMNAPARQLLGVLVRGRGAAERAVSVGLVALLMSREVRGALKNADTLGPELLWVVRRQAALDPEMDALLVRLLADESIPAAWKEAGEPPGAAMPVRPVELEVDGVAQRLWATVATLGTAADVSFERLWLLTLTP